jgi:hypothetical protein
MDGWVVVEILKLLCPKKILLFVPFFSRVNQVTGAPRIEEK